MSIVHLFIKINPMNTNTVQMRLYPVQADFIRSTATYRGFVGGRGAGKSVVGSYDLLRRAKPNRLYMVVAPTFGLLKDTSFRVFVQKAQELRFLKKINHQDLRVVLGHDAEVLFRSADNPDRLRGSSLSGFWMDEASYCDEGAYKIVIACLREAGEQGWGSLTFTPRGKSHWTYREFGQNEAIRQEIARCKTQGIPYQGPPCDPDRQLFTAKTHENPFLPKSFETTLRRQYSSEMAKQELEGAFLDAGGKVFNRAWFRHIVTASPAQARRIRFWDKASTEDGGCYTRKSFFT
jgi:phage terminase large subunit-like protein